MCNCARGDLIDVKGALASLVSRCTIVSEGNVCEHASSDEEEDYGGDGTGVSVINRLQSDVIEPTMYRVILHNDDYTPMDFVIMILEKYFRKSFAQATDIMLDVHEKGIGICGVYPHEIAETKVAAVSDEAKKHEYPLKCSCEKD